MCKTSSLLLLALAVTVTSALSNEEILSRIKASCKRENHTCPKPGYGSFTKGEPWRWDEDKILNSNVAISLREAKDENRTNHKIDMVLRITFCCYVGECKRNCGVSGSEPELSNDPEEPKEKELVRNFPWNGHKLLSLNFGPLKKHESAVREWLSEEKTKEIATERIDFPDYIDDFLDDVHHNHDEIKKLMGEKMQDGFFL